MLVRELTDGQEIDQALLVRERELKVGGDGGEYLRLMLGDRTGAVAAVVWDGIAEVRGLCEPGEVVRVRARFAIHSPEGGHLVVRSLRAAAPEEFEHGALFDGPRNTAAQLEADQIGRAHV